MSIAEVSCYGGCQKVQRDDRVHQAAKHQSVSQTLLTASTRTVCGPFKRHSCKQCW